MVKWGMQLVASEPPRAPAYYKLPLYVPVKILETKYSSCIIITNDTCIYTELMPRM
jgi:hypothetical protein